MTTKKIKNFATANNIPLPWADQIAGSYGGTQDDMSKVNGKDDYLVIFCWDGGIDVSSGDMDHVQDCCSILFHSFEEQTMSIYDRNGHEKSHVLPLL